MEYVMKDKQSGITLIIHFILLLNLCSIQSLMAQRASAEFISELEPPSLLTGQNVKDGIQNVYYHNNILYVINIWAGIQIVDVSNMNEPKEIGHYQNEHRAHNLFIEGDYGFLSDELAGVEILDMSNLRAPVRISKINTDGDAWWVESQYPYVYVAEGEKGVGLYDLSDIYNPVLVSYFDTPGWAWELSVQDDYVYVGDKTGGLQIINYSDKKNPILAAQFNDPVQAKSTHIENNILFLTDGPNGLFIIDVKNPKFPTLVSKIDVEGFVFDAFKGGKYAYMANESARTLNIINLSDITNPKIEASYQADDKVYGVWKEDVYVFVAANNKTLILRHNSPPILAEIEPQSVDEQTILTITPQGYDPDGDDVYYAISNMPDGAVLDSLSGIFSWTPTYEQSGTYDKISIRIIERTASQLYADQQFTVTVNHVNRPPSIPDVENFSINENEVLTFNIQEGSDEDKEDTGKLAYLAENLPQGAVFDPTTRTFIWTPSYEQSGIYVIDFIVKDPPGALDRDASTITVTHVDRKPSMAPISDKSVDENQPLQFTIEGSDPDTEDQNAISFSAYNLPEGATFNPATRTVSWTPTHEQSGIYQQILFVIKAGALSDSSTMNITVNHVSRPPVMNVIALKMVDEQQELSFTVSASDPDAEDQDKLVYTTSNLPEGARFNADSLRFTWIPTYEQSGEYNDITFTVRDEAGLQDTKSTTITVNHVNRPPVLTEIQAQKVDENSILNFTLLGSDPDKEDQDKLQYSISELPAGAVLEGNTFTWTPTYEQSGTYPVEYILSDGRLSDTKSTTITVNHINRPPVIEPIEAQTVDEGQLLEFKVVGNDPDPEDIGKWVISVAQLPPGAQFVPETATFTWTPDFDQAGTYTVEFSNTDEQGLSAAQTVQITVNHVNRTPVFNPLAAQTVDENFPLNISIPPGEDPDVEDAQKLTYSVQNLPEGATFDDVNLTLSWTPNFEQSGAYEVQFTCTDGEFTVNQPLQINVTHVNRPPAIEAIGDQSIDENDKLVISINYQDPDQEDEGKLVLSASNLPTGANFVATQSEITWTPTFEQAGLYQQINVTVADPSGLTDAQIFNITVTNVNRAPSLQAVEKLTVSENEMLTYQFSGSDPDAEDEGKLTYYSENLPNGATIDPTTGTLTWTPNYIQAGNYNINIELKDAGGLSASTSVSVEVSNVNRPPVMQSVEDQSVNENNTLSLAISVSDEDSDDQLRFSSENLPSGAVLNAESGTMQWTPNYDQAGDYTVTVKVSDSEAEDSQTFNIKVNNVNRVPVIEVSGTTTVTLGETIELNFTATDPDNDNLSYESSDLPQGAMLDSNSGRFTWKPEPDQIGSYSFTVRVTDGTDAADITGNVTVNPAPTPPEPDQEN